MIIINSSKLTMFGTMFGNDFFNPFPQRTYQPVRTHRPTRRYGNPYSTRRPTYVDSYSTRPSTYIDQDITPYQTGSRQTYQPTKRVRHNRETIRRQKINIIAATMIQRWWRNQQKRLKLKNAKLIKRYLIEEVEEEPDVNTKLTLPDDYPYVLCHIDDYRPR